MKYQCGHSACDLCGGHRRCDPNAGHLSTIANLLVCNRCLNRAVRFTYDVACKFGGTVIDVTKPCAKPKRDEKPKWIDDIKSEEKESLIAEGNDPEFMWPA